MIRIIAIVALAASVGSSLDTDNKEQTLSYKTSTALANLEIYSGIEHPERFSAELRDNLSQEDVVAAYNLLSDGSFADKLQQLPRMRALSSAIQKNPVTSSQSMNRLVERLAVTYFEERRNILGNTNNYELIKDGPTGRLAYTLACKSTADITEELVHDSMVEMWEKANVYIESLADAEKRSILLGNMFVKVIFEKSLMQLVDPSQRDRVIPTFREGLAKYDYKIQC